MGDYTVIVDDSNGQITYGPDEDAWGSVDSSDHAYQGTLHNALAQDAILKYAFVGGRELVIRGNFKGDNNASDSATYPIFQVDSENLDCTPNPPQNGGQFLCFTALPPKIANHSLSMFVNPNAATQQFHIDYIRYGSSSQAAQAASGTVLNVQAPDNSTSGLSFDSQWDKVKLGNANDVKNAMQTSTPSSTATYHFVGDSFAWWGCCMPPGTSSNAANVAYSIDGGDLTPIQIDGQFLQGPQCKDEKILFQTQAGQLTTGNHTLEVVYNGDNTKMPLTLCALAASPVDFSALDVDHSGSHDHHSDADSSTQTLTLTTTPTPATPTPPPDAALSGSPDISAYSNKPESTEIIAGVIAGIIFAFLSLFIVVYLLRRKRTRDVESRMFFNAPRLAIRRVVPSVDLTAHSPPTRRTSVDKESILEVPPPFYRSSMTKSQFSWRGMSFRAQPHQQTAYVGSDYGASVLSFNPRNSSYSTRSSYNNYQQSEPPRYKYGSKSNDLDPILPLP